MRRVIAELAEAMRRIGYEYSDVARATREGTRTFAAVAYMAPLVKSETVRFVSALRAINGAKVLPAGHDAEFELVAPRGSAVLWARLDATSAESAAQVFHSLIRRALDDADLTIDKLHVEVEAAPVETQEGDDDAR